jgi:diguanylate cyclase (GGDEF)-like protein
MGLGTLEDALERLRQANLERETLTQQTIEQRREIEQNLEDLAEKTREMAHLARHDPLTGLANRRDADDFLGSLGATPDGCTQDFTLLHVDIDRFKEINDTLGHDAGDAVLTHVSGVLQKLSEASDRAFRISGDEFLIVRSPRGSQAADHDLADAIIAELNQPVDYKGHACRVGASIGIAHGADVDFSGREALVNADIALYEAKSSGRNQFVEFSRTLQEQTVSRKTLSDRLIIAMENDEFVPYYQPQFYSDSLALHGLETLCRWHHPELGVLSPAHFMEQAEASTLVGKIDQLLLDKAARDLAHLKTLGHAIPNISFNATADRLMQADFASSLMGKFDDETKVSIELLESMSLDNLSEAVRWAIDMLKEHGIKIEIDDFGSSRASIAGLIAVGPDAMKIDGTIVAPITESEQHLHLVRAIIDIGHALGIQVIAERVETDAHIQILRDNGCEILQGYALAKPMNVTQLAEFLENRANQAPLSQQARPGQGTKSA